MPDGRRVKKRTVTSYEELDEPRINSQQQKQQQALKEPAKPMTPIEIMMATQFAMRETFNNAKTTRNDMNS